MPNFSPIKAIFYALACVLISLGASPHAPASCIQNLSRSESSHTHSSGATYGGAQYGYESSISQQILYLQSSLPQLLTGWGYSLIPDAIYIDAEYDIDNQPFQRYTYDARGNVVLYKHIPRTVRFYFKNQNDQVWCGKIYLIEQMTSNENQKIPVNSTRGLTKELRRGPTIEFSLSSSLNPTHFALELSHSDFLFHISSDDSAFGPSSPQLAHFVKEKLNTYLDPLGYKMIQDSVDVAYYYDHRMIMRFKDRQGHLVTFLVRDEAGHVYSGSTHLWQSHRRHQRVLYPRNSTLTIFNEPLSLKPFELWLAQGYLNHDARVELSALNFNFRKLK